MSDEINKNGNHEDLSSVDASGNTNYSKGYFRKIPRISFV